MKQFGLAVIQYTQDYDEVVPKGTRETSIYTYGAGWAGQLYPYVKSTQVYKCPSDENPQGVTVSYGYNGQYGGYRLTSGQPATVAPLGPNRLSIFGNVAKTVVLFEISRGRMNLAGATSGFVACNPSSATPETCAPVADFNPASGWGGRAYMATESNYSYFATGLFGNLNSRVHPSLATDSMIAPEARHLEGSNYLFADGHAKWLKASVVSFGVNNSTAGNCGNANRFSSNSDCDTYQATFGIF